MPQIKVTINDNTGTEVTSEESVVFIPGSVAINPSYVDDNDCVYISASQYSKLNNILVKEGGAKYTEDDLKTGPVVTVGTLSLIEECLKAGLDVIYCHVEGYAQGNTLPEDLKFLLDKDTYNIKFLTTGYFGGLKVPAVTNSNVGKSPLSDSDWISSWTVDTTEIKTLGDIASKRTDCSILAAVDYYSDAGTMGANDKNYKLKPLGNIKNGDVAARDLSTILYNSKTNSELLQGYGDYTYILFPNIISTMTLSSDFHNVSAELTMPSYYPYLMKYAQALKNGQEWLPLANSTRGGLTGLGTPDLTCTKYCFDENIIKDRKLEDLHVEKGVSFNGIVELKPYGQVIWGDRTCMLIDETVKATAYQSLRMLLCDVSKRAYQAAVRYTYESNNEVTWFNFKSRVTELLSEMVASGVLSGFDMRRQPSPTLNTIVCKITLYPNLPVENFDIYINLENAEVTTENGEDDEE